jgi:hypothetical protein
MIAIMKVSKLLYKEKTILDECDPIIHASEE